MAGVTIHKDFGAQENKVYQIRHCFQSYAMKSRHGQCVDGDNCGLQALLAACAHMVLGAPQHVGSRSPTSKQTLAPCIGSMEF